VQLAQNLDPDGQRHCADVLYGGVPAPGLSSGLAAGLC